LRAFDVAPGVANAPTRTTSTLVTLGGRQYSQYAPRAPRTWSCNMTETTPDQIALAKAFSAGAIPGPLYLIPYEATFTNMLPPHVAAPGSGGDTTLGTVSASTVPVGIRGGYLPSFAADKPSVAGTYVGPFPVRPGATYVLSCWSSAATSALAWKTASSVAGTAVQSGTISTVAYGSGFRGTASFTPTSTTETALWLRLPSGSGAVGGLRLTEGPPESTDWLPGDGVQAVTITDPQQTLNLILQDGVPGLFSDWSFTILEEG